MPTSWDDLLALTVVIALGFLVAVAFYESLSTRDVLVGRAGRLARRLSHRRWVHGLAYVAAVGVGIPILVVVWTTVLFVALIFVGSVDRIASDALIATAIVGAVRVLAYARQKTAHELAKAVPLALAFLLLTGGALAWEEKVQRIVEQQGSADLTNEMLGFLIALELGLRILTDASRALLAGIRRRRGIESDLGAWRTLWAALRRPVVRLEEGLTAVAEVGSGD